MTKISVNLTQGMDGIETVCIVVQAISDACQQCDGIRVIADPHPI